MAAVDEFDRWIRNEFVAFNTELEEAYFSARTEIEYGRQELDDIKQAILLDGAQLIGRVGSIPTDPEGRYQLLGAVGLYLAACRRHEVENAEVLATTWSLANLLGTSLGVAPRFVFAHESIHNPAVRDTFRTFTSLEDEYLFVTYNSLAVLAYQRAAAALRRVPVLGVSSPIATYLFEDARTALDDVLSFNRTLADKLDVERFFLNIRPYFKSYRVGGTEYRGANAGDFSAINEIDLLLGLCEAGDPFYQHLLAEKYAYLPPEDQEPLRNAVGGVSLLDTLLREATESVTPQLRHNAELFLAICRAHGAAYAFHHHQLVKPFLAEPAATAPEDRRPDLTASGPPLDVVLSGLARLSDLRAARDRPGLRTARASLGRLRALLTDA